MRGWDLLTIKFSRETMLLKEMMRRLRVVTESSDNLPLGAIDALQRVPMRKPLV